MKLEIKIGSSGPPDWATRPAPPVPARTPHRAIGSGRSALLGVILTTALALQGCASLSRLGPVPAARTTQAVVVDTPNARFFPDEQPGEMFAEGMRALEREMQARNISDPKDLPPAHFLAVSGGGDDGAFGAGLLTAWTQTGTRPEFKIVTGVSTGSLTAPFAFLGPDYDDELREVYTKTSADNIFIERGLLTGMLSDALSDTSPLFALISKHVNADMLSEIAREYREGRLLLIGTTDLDARRPVVWNIGAIAASGHPDAPELIHKILLASAAVPAAFPPVMIDAEVDGERYQEMHVDGGAIAQLFLYPPEVGRLMTASGIGRERHAYIIRNGRVGPEWSEVERATIDIANRAISTMIHTSGLNDLFRIYILAQRDGVDYNLAYIEDDFSPPSRQGDFDPNYMNALFNYGAAKARQAYPWKKTPLHVEEAAARQ